jgi:hypothetical protein
LRHQQLAIGAEAPAVVRAGERLGVAMVVLRHLHAAVAAGVEEHMDGALAVAHQDDRLGAHARDEVVPGVRNLALVAHKQPGPGKDAFTLFLKHLPVGKDRAVDQALAGVNHLGVVHGSPDR